ncbi:hypothetical protein [uncultured Enterococcus sp.]|uniref:hypothetical protein n=1 Tax=uncultured Enterococcus sp. TaxID=167972 RepID=UPI0022D16643|nr:hypothetical protein [uncultured Enterococcus sp.]CAI3400830.1 hypothetical protein CIRMBP1197_01521 [Enterococcus cecorum]
MDQETFTQLLLENKELLQQFLQENLLTRDSASQITKQSTRAFEQSVNTHIIQPFYSVNKNGRQIFKLYLKQEMEAYAQSKRKINKQAKES